MEEPGDLFRFDVASSTQGWAAVDDRVMGGVSQSRLRFDAGGFAVFEGHVSLARNGGFASVRAVPATCPAADALCFVLKVRGDGQRYKLSLRCEKAFDGISYQTTFEPPAGQWVTLRLSVAALSASFRGRSVGDAPPFAPAQLRQVGLMIADQQAGDFALALRSIGWA